MNERYATVKEKIINGLKEFQDLFSLDYYYRFEELIDKMDEEIKESEREGRLLKIGIVGEVKAGKSSFLNALIFKGNDVLPKASTPMTAALTKISYSEEQSAKIFFYSRKDWDKIVSISEKYDEKFSEYYDEYCKRQQEKYQVAKVLSYSDTKIEIKTREEMRKSFERSSGMSTKLIVCKELTDMVKNSSLEIERYLGSAPISISIKDLSSELAEYIGSKGKYAPIVKHVELKINNPLLKDFEIVDTPGLNDPILSRGETTKQFLRNCDVVLLLSYCGQFLTSEDIDFMCKTLPREGIKNIIIIGSKFDSGVLDDNKSKDYRNAFLSSMSNYNKQAESNINETISCNNENEILFHIKASLPPSYVSSILYSCGGKLKRGEKYSEYEAHIINQLTTRFTDFPFSDYKALLSLSGFGTLKKEKLQAINSEKIKIIKEKNRDLIVVKKGMLLSILEDINSQVIHNRETLNTYDKEQLEKKYYTLQNKLNSMRREIKNIFESCAVEADKYLNYMKVSIDHEIDNYEDFTVKSTTQHKKDIYSKGFLGLFEKIDEYDETTHLASTADVLSNLRGYLVRCKQLSNDEFEKIINLRKLREAIKDAVLGIFELSGTDFNENDVLIPLDIVVNRVKIPKINIEISEFEPMLIDAFSDAYVKDDDIHALKIQEVKILHKISEKVKGEIDECGKTMDSMLAEQATTFVDNLISLLAGNLDALKKQIDDKENAIKHYIVLCEQIKMYKNLLINMEF